jgi:hypothetical protein
MTRFARASGWIFWRCIAVLPCKERSRKPHRSPKQTPEHVVEVSIELCRRHPSWGATKRLSLLHKRQPSWPLPGHSTGCDILRRHQRMLRSLKADTPRPQFIPLMHHNVASIALDMQPPASRYEASPREMPNTLPPLAYPNRFQVRYASAKGDIRWNRQWVNISITCASQYVSLKEIDEGVWNVYFGALKLGRLHERHMRIEDALGRLR